ncbi:MAG: hypothetical protein HPY59_19340 [Anaerolineae bacterium]|nr:hypothetical protein [Anaerolineae bacterium]
MKNPSPAGKRQQIPAKRRRGELLLSLLAGGALAGIGYLYLINPALPTPRQVLMLAGIFLVSALVCFTILTQVLAARLAVLGWKMLVLLAVCGAAWGALAVGLFPHFPKLAASRTITIQVLDDKNPRSQGNFVRVVYLHSDIQSDSLARFTTEGGWQVNGEEFTIENGRGARLTWHGRALNSVTIGLEASPTGGMALIRWDKEASEELDLYADTPRVITASREFSPSFFSRALVTGNLWLVFALAGFLALAACLPAPLFRLRALETPSAFRWLALAGLAAALLVIFENSGLLRDYPLRDSSVFLYSGQNILSGGIPYRDVWDHKGPLIYFINAVGLLIGNGSRLGVLLIELLFVACVFLALYRGVEKIWGPLAAFGASVTLLAGLDRLYDGGNLTEEYALLFQALSILALLAYLKRPAWQHAAGTGLLAALGFLLRPNLISTQMLAGGILLLEALRRREQGYPTGWQILAALAGGFMAPVLVVILFFAWHHALGDLFDQMIIYNLLYSQNSGISPSEQILIPFNVLKHLWITPLAVAGLVFGFAGLWKEKEAWVQRLLLLGCIDLLAGLAIYNVSGRGFRHYFLNILPAASILAGYLSWKLSVAAVALKKILAKSHSGYYLFAFSMATWIFINLAFYLPDFIRKVRAVAAPVEKCNYLNETLEEKDTVLMWGIETPFYITTDRRAPTRFIYQTQLAQPWYGSARMGEELVAALEREKTPVIVDTSPTNSEFPPLSEDPAAPDRFSGVASIAVVRSYVTQHYRLEGSLPCFTEEWKLYRRLPVSPKLKCHPNCQS